MSVATTTLYLADPYGRRLQVLEAWTELEYSRAVNAVSPLKVSLPGESLDWRLAKRDMRIEAWRSIDGATETLDTETVWLLRGRRRWLTRAGVEMVQLRAKSANCLLERRVVPAVKTSSQASKTAAADNLMKAIVREQLGSSATDATRSLASYLAVQADLSLGPSITKTFSYRKVDKTLQELALAATTAGTPVFFDIVSPSQGALEFRTYVQQRGTDHSRTGLNPVTVSPERESLEEPAIDEDWDDEVTSIYGLGAGQEELRLVANSRDAARVGLSPFGLIEDVINAGQADSTALLTAEINSALRDGRPRRTFSGRLVDTPAMQYGRDWKWGDRLTAAYGGEEYTCRVDAVQVKIVKGQETISAALRLED